MKPLVIYHDSCADGFGAAFAAWLKLGDNAKYVPMQYGDLDTKTIPIIKGRDVYILDFSFPKRIMECIFEDANRVVWLDHHKTAFEMWCPHYLERGRFENDFDTHFITLDNNKSGAYLAWEYFHPNTEVPLFIRHIDDYDRWVFAIEGTKAFQKALWSYAPWSFKQWEQMWDDIWGFSTSSGLEGMNKFYGEGTAILRAHSQNVQATVKGGARKCVIECKENVPVTDTPFANSLPGPCLLPGLAANCPPHLQSDVGHELANQSGTFGLLWFIDKENVCRCSLRSMGDYDVSAIAKAFGGGGHRNAAGFTTDISTLLEWIK